MSLKIGINRALKLCTTKGNFIRVQKQRFFKPLKCYNHMEKRGKKAQFYLISAVILIVVVMGLSGITNYSKATKKPLKFYDLSEELNEEGARIIDYGIYNDNPEAEIYNIIKGFMDENFTEYSKDKEQGSEFVFVRGNEKSAKVVTYTIGSSGRIFFANGPEVKIKDYKAIESSTANQDSVKVKVLNKSYDFPLGEQQSFYFVIIKEKDGETYVAKSHEVIA